MPCGRGRGPRAEEPVNLADDPERLRREFRTFALEVLRLVAAGAADAVLGRLRAASPDEDVPWSLDDLREKLRHFWDSPVSTGLAARAPENTHLTEAGDAWRLQQTIVDARQSGWTLGFALDLPATAAADRVRARLTHFGPGSAAAAA
eukprot:EG_transcript_26495